MIVTSTQQRIFSDSGVNRSERRKSLKGSPVPLGRGGRQVQLETDRAGLTGSGSIHTAGQYGGFWTSHSQKTDVTQTGNAYRCDPADIGLD